MNMVSFENGFFFQKVRTKPRTKFFNKSINLVKIFFEIVLLGVHSYKVHTVDVLHKLG
jgi:hypothetical protein